MSKPETIGENTKRAYEAVKATLPAEPSRKSVRYHALGVSAFWGAAGLLLAGASFSRDVSIDWRPFVAIGCVQIAALLIHTSSKTIDLNRWMARAADIAVKFAPGGSES